MLPEDDEATAPFMNLVRDFARLGGGAPREAGHAAGGNPGCRGRIAGV